MPYKNIEEVFKGFTQLKVLIIGDTMLDSYVWGAVDRISPEAPVPILKVKKRENRLGGAGNVAQNLQSLGCTPILLSVTGSDREGIILKDLMSQNGLNDEGIIVSDHRTTTVKERLIAGTQQMLRVDTEDSQDLSSGEENQLISKIRHFAESCDLIIFEDYDKGVITGKIIKKAVQIAQQLRIPTVVDPKKKNFLKYRNVSLFKPNLKEINDGLKQEIEKGDLVKLAKAVNTLRKNLHAETILVTLSEHGLLANSSKGLVHLPAHKREIADVSGAGDTVVSIAGICYALGLPTRFMAELANIGGGLVCEHPGVVPVDKKQLFREAKKRHLERYLRV